MEATFPGLKRYLAGMRIRSAVWLCLGCSLSALACAPFQTVPVDIGPAGSSVYLNGEVLDEEQREVKLRSDRVHTVLVKRDGHRGELVVLRSIEREGDPVLEPPAIRVRLKPVTSGRREVLIEVSDPGEEAAP